MNSFSYFESSRERNEWPARISGPGMNTRARTALAAGLIAVPAATGTAVPAATSTAVPAATGTAQPAASHRAVPSPRGPSLAISVSDGRATAAAGDRLTYTVSVRDTGSRAAPHLKITQTLSQGLEFVSASGDGVATAGRIAWHATVPAGGTRTFRVIALVTRPPAQVSRLAAIACVAVAGGSRPIVCAAHLDRLPAAAQPAAAGSGASGGRLLAYTGGALAVLAAGLATVIASRRRRGRWPRA